MFDITKLPAYYFEKYGEEKVREIVGAAPNVFGIWKRDMRFPLDAVQKMLEFDPAPLSEVRPLYENPPNGQKIAILMPCIGEPKAKTMDCIVKLMNPKEMVFQRAATTYLDVSRNELAAWALRQDFEWLYWQDADMVVPCGDAAWYKNATENPM